MIMERYGFLFSPHRVRIVVAGALCAAQVVFSQPVQVVFSRGEATTGNWWDSSNPWKRLCDDWFLDRPDKNTCNNWTEIGRNDVFIGHNNNNPMYVNGAWFQLRDMTIQAEVTIARTYNQADIPSGLSFSRGLYNSSNYLQTFNVPVGVDGTSVEFEAKFGDLSFTQDFYINSNTAVFSGSETTTVSGVMQGTNGNVSKIGSGTLILTNPGNTYSGNTTISAGQLRLNPTANATMNSQFRLNGGTLSTQGIASGISFTNSSGLLLDASSSIVLASQNHDIRFANSSSLIWNSGATLTIFNWQGTPGFSGTAGQIFIGTDSNGLTASQLGQISFNGFPNGAMLLPSGELVPAPSNLPVTFLGMSVSCNVSHAVIQWETASERNASHFVVERSTNGTYWEPIGVVEAVGNTALNQSYEFTDQSPVRVEVSYYRLVQFDFDGHSETFGTIALRCELPSKHFDLFPNPSSGIVYISFNWDKYQTNFQSILMDLSGRIISEGEHQIFPGNNLLVHEISTAFSGSYIMVLMENGQVVESLHVVRH
jgi:autotransporter-associated beta strand protein